MPRIRDIVGHATQIAELRTDLQAGNVAHAYLFSGPSNLGKMGAALWFARELLCIDKSDRHDECTRSMERLTHPDLLVLDQLWIEEVCEDWDTIAQSSNVPQVHRSKKTAAKTDTISIDDIRALQDRLIERGLGRYRCCIIRSVERMQDAAANALLKILEEPPQGLVFLLTTEALGALLPTITSRSRVLRFRRLPDAEMQLLLKGIPPEEAQFLLRIAQGAPGLALSLRDDPDRLRARRLLHGKAQSFWKARTLRERLQLLDPLAERGEEADSYLVHLGLALRETGPDATLQAVSALSALAQACETNAHRKLLLERFALAVTEKVY